MGLKEIDSVTIHIQRAFKDTSIAIDELAIQVNKLHNRTLQNRKNHRRNPCRY